MWNVARADLQSATLNCAVKLGFIDRTEAEAIDDHVGRLGCPVLNWLVVEGYLNDDEARTVSLARQRDFPAEHALESAKAARAAVERSDTGLTRLEDVLRARQQQ